MGVILLVRHGQASFGSADYDVLSPLGEQQAHCLGEALATRGIRPTSVISGSMRRQRATAEALVKQAGWDLEVAVDEAWNEFDLGGLVADPASGHEPPGRRAYQDSLEEGMRRWAGTTGAPAAGTSFADFTARTESALRAIAATPGATALVATSAGVIGWLAASLLGAGVDQWIRLNRVCVNTGVTMLVAGRQGTSLVAFNDHSHLSQQEVTYR